MTLPEEPCAALLSRSRPSAVSLRQPGNHRPAHDGPTAPPAKREPVSLLFSTGLGEGKGEGQYQPVLSEWDQAAQGLP
ncbi:hypothetical protein GCM10011612_17960 [Actinomyces gaoshouyii]|uniref:Uncharacterized protein n=1 Tax=Actinomyces gaoshouyii TaxID=1960083 RepID=A0A8H9HAB2_9ACTO|nr:hypothetical protein GCM10011612_17960 [Actinomyces gaoshouyii]